MSLQMGAIWNASRLDKGVCVGDLSSKEGSWVRCEVWQSGQVKEHKRDDGSPKSTL